MGLAFRRAVEADAPAIVRVVNGAYRGEAGRHGWTSEHELVAGARIDEQGVRALLARPATTALLVAERGAPGDIVGTVLLDLRGAPGECHLGLLSVRVSEQASGVGRALLAHAEAFARDAMGARLVSMHVIDSRAELLAWYERRGYRRTGARVPFTPPASERLLRGPVSFERLEKELAPP